MSAAGFSRCTRAGVRAAWANTAATSSSATSNLEVLRSERPVGFGACRPTRAADSSNRMSPRPCQARTVRHAPAAERHLVRAERRLRHRPPEGARHVAVEPGGVVRRPGLMLEPLDEAARCVEQREQVVAPTGPDGPHVLPRAPPGVKGVEAPLPFGAKHGIEHRQGLHEAAQARRVGQGQGANGRDFNHGAYPTSLPKPRNRWCRAAWACRL